MNHVSLYIKTEAIELEPRVAKPIQLGEHGAIGFPKSGVFVLLRDNYFPSDFWFGWL